MDATIRAVQEDLSIINDTQGFFTCFWECFAIYRILFPFFFCVVIQFSDYLYLVLLFLSLISCEFICLTLYKNPKG